MLIAPYIYYDVLRSQRNIYGYFSLLDVYVDRIGWQPEQPGKGQIKLYEIYVYALAYDREHDRK